MRKFVWSIILAVCVASAPQIANAQNETATTNLRAALFIQDKTGSAMPENIALLNDIIAAKLTQNGFSIVEYSVALSKLREAKSDEQICCNRCKKS